MNKLLDLLERAAWTAGQQFVAVLLAASSAKALYDMPWELALGTAIGAFVVSAATTLIQFFIRPLNGRGFIGDLITRLVKTFLASFLGALGANQVVNVFETDVNDVQAAFNLALVTTVLALGKGALAGGGATENATPSTLSYGRYRAATGGK